MLAIYDGIVVNDSWSGPATVIIDGDRIKAVQNPDAQLPDGVQKVISAEGRLVLPGGVDPHLHVDTKIGAHQTLDNYAQASEAALWGGTTTMVDFAIPLPDETPLEATRRRLREVPTSHTDVALHGCVVEWDDSTASDLRAMADLGVRTVKMFTTYRDVVMVSDDTLLAVIRELREVGGIAYVHAESNHLIEDVHAKRTGEGEMGPASHPATRPTYTEVAAVKSVISTAEALNAHVYLVHQSTPESAREITRARERGASVYSETCPHYLFLTDDVYQGPEPERFVCCPPLRSAANTEEMRARLVRGEIHTIGSDHNCFSLEQKRKANDDVRKMPNGLPGAETRLPVSFSELVVRGGMPAEQFVRLVASNPARLTGLFPRKGAIAPGSDADIVIFDPSATRVVRTGDLHMQTDYDPYEGRTVTGWPEIVISAGELVIDETGFHPRDASGRFIPSDPVGDSRIC